MITPEQLTKHVKLCTQEAWRTGTNTTLNEIVEYILRETLLNCIMPELETLNDRVEELYNENEVMKEFMAAYHEANDASPPIPHGTVDLIKPHNMNIVKEVNNASNERGLQKSQRRAKAVE